MKHALRRLSPNPISASADATRGLSGDGLSSPTYLRERLLAGQETIAHTSVDDGQHATWN